MKLPIETENPLFGKYLYPEAKEIMELQQDSSWTAQEIPVEKDIQDYKVNMSTEQYNLVTTTLQTFVDIEQDVGDTWETIASWFPHSEIEGACIEIARMEKSVHAFFYQKMSDVLNIEPETIISNQQNVAVIRDKLTLLKSIFSNLSENKLVALGTVALVEQVLLFSNFGLLKSFQANGHNLIKNTVTGVDYVQADEALHGVFASYLFNTYVAESGKPIPAEVADTILAVATSIIDHEDSMIDYIFSNTESINSIRPQEMKLFIRSRTNSVFEMLNLPLPYQNTTNTVEEWFYRGINSIKSHDFFSGITNQYSKSWSMDNFSRLPHLKEPADD